MAQGSGLKEKHSPVKAWARALELTAPIASNPDRTFPTVIEKTAEAVARIAAAGHDIDAIKRL